MLKSDSTLEVTLMKKKKKIRLECNSLSFRILLLQHKKAELVEVNRKNTTSKFGKSV